MSGARRLEMIRHHPDLSLACQCALLGISRSSLYYQPTHAKVKDLELMTLMDRQYLKTPFYGSRRMSVWLRREGYLVNRKRVRRLMRVMGIEAIYRRPNTSRPSPENKVYPYLLRGLEVSGVNQVWMADITYIPMARGFLYLVAIMDWYSRYVLAWRLSNTLDADFCVDALEEALRQGKPEIFNTDQGSQFTSEAFTSMLLEHGIRISMDGKGRYIDNIFVERLWRSVKYEEVYLKAYQNVPEARAGIGAYLRFYNHERPHQALGYQTPQEIFEEGQGWRCLHEQGLALPSNLETTSPVMVPTKPAEDSLNLALSLSTPPVNYRYTVVLQPKLGEWPPPVTRAIPRMGLEGRLEEYNRRQRGIRQQAKERGLCTSCQRQPAQPNMAYCEHCCKKRREYGATKKQRPDRPSIRGSKPAVDVPKDFFWSKQDRFNI